MLHALYVSLVRLCLQVGLVRIRAARRRLLKATEAAYQYGWPDRAVLDAMEQVDEHLRELDELEVRIINAMETLR